MSAILQFTLGLATGNFLSAIAGATDGMKEFLGEMLSVGAIMDGVFESINKGAGLEALHRRTGAAISDIYELQQGFKSAGLDGDDVSGSLFQLQKALGGVNEMGESTPDIFRKMGLSIDQLKGENAPQQLNSILGALNKLGTSDAANAAAGIFGRMNAGNMIQLSHSAQDFSSAMAEAAEEGKNWERIAPLFNEVSTALNKIKELGEGFFAGIAEGIAPALESGLNFLESFKSTLTNMGDSIGHMFRGISEAFKEGKIGELLDLTFAASVEFLINMLSETLGSGSFWSGIAEEMAGSFIAQFAMLFKIAASLGTTLIAALDTAFQKLYEEIGKTKLGTVLGIGGYKAESFDKNYAREKANGADGQAVLDQMTVIGTSMYTEGYGKIGGAIKDAFAKSGGPEQDALKHFFDGLIGNSPKEPKSAEVKPGTGTLETEKYTYRPEFTAFEKMGFVGSGGNSPSVEYARRTADGVAQMCTLMETTVSLLSGGSGIAKNAI